MTDQTGRGRPPVRGVLFDAGGVLLLPHPDEFRKVSAPFGVQPDDETCRRAHYAGMHEVDRLGTDDWSAVDRVVARNLGIPAPDVEAGAASIADIYLGTTWVPVAGAVETLQAVEDAGYQLAVVSNASGTMEAQLARHEICSVDGGSCVRVEIVVDSEVVGIEKPDPAIFGIALEALGLGAAECVYVGDSVHFDVNGARAAGLHPFHLDPFGLCPDDDHDHLAAITDLPAALGRPGDPV